MHEEEPFLKRWSRRKLAAKQGDEAPSPSAPPGQAPTLAPPQDASVGRDAPPSAPARGQATSPAAADFADVDFEALDFQSDYARFLAPGVPDAIKNRALRKLWESNPIFTAADPYQDYQGDYTDAALAVPAGTLKTAYRIGRGFLSDAEVVQLDARGKGAEGATPAADAPLAPASCAPVTIAAPEAADRGPLAALLRKADAMAEAHLGRPGEASAVLGRANARLVVAHTAAAIVGCGASLIDGDGTARIAVLFVATEARRAKIGTRILARLEEEARAQGVQIMRVEADARQREALALLRRQGYTQRAGLAADRREEARAIFEKPLHCGRQQAACAAAPRRQ